jgi:hypothetical protein
MTSDAIKDVALPLSGLHLQWRPADAHCRVIKDSYAKDPQAAALFDWVAVTGSQSRSVGTYRVDVDRTSVVFGERTESVTVEVRPHDGATTAAYHAGPLWAAEWTGEPGDATVRWLDVEDSLTVFVGHRADYLA